MEKYYWTISHYILNLQQQIFTILASIVTETFFQKSEKKKKITYFEFKLP